MIDFDLLKSEEINRIRWNYYSSDGHSITKLMYIGVYRCRTCGFDIYEGGYEIPPDVKKPCRLKSCAKPGLLRIIARLVDRVPVRGVAELAEIDIIGADIA